MLEVPKSKWERVLPFALIGIAVLVVGAVGVAMLVPRLTASEAASTAVSATLTSAPGAPVLEDTAPQNEWVNWEAGKATTYRVGGFDLSFSAVVEDELNVAKLRVATADSPPTDLTGNGLSWPAQADFAVIQLDAGSPERQLLFASFSGGAHCCTNPDDA